MRVTGRRSFVCPRLGREAGGSLRPGGRGQSRLRPSPLPRFPGTRRVRASSPAVTPPPAPLAREGRRGSRPPRVGPGRARPGAAGTAPASDRRGGAGGGRMGVGGRADPGIGPRRRLAGRRLNLAGGEDGAVCGSPPGSACKKPGGPSRRMAHPPRTEPKRGGDAIGFLVLSLLADTDRCESDECTFLRGNRTRAGGGSAPLFS